PAILQREVHPQGFALQFVNSWHTIGPAAVMLLAGEPRATWSRFPLVLAVLGAQFGADLASSAVRGRLVLDVPLRDHLPVLGWVYLVDTTLTPCAFAVAVAAAATPYAALAPLPLVGLLALLGRERQRRIDHALELGRAYRGTAFLL